MHHKRHLQEQSFSPPFVMLRRKSVCLCLLIFLQCAVNVKHGIQNASGICICCCLTLELSFSWIVISTEARKQLERHFWVNCPFKLMETGLYLHVASYNRWRMKTITSHRELTHCYVWLVERNVYFVSTVGNSLLNFWNLMNNKKVKVASSHSLCFLVELLKKRLLCLLYFPTCCFPVLEATSIWPLPSGKKRGGNDAQHMICSAFSSVSRLNKWSFVEASARSAANKNYSKINSFLL